MFKTIKKGTLIFESEQGHNNFYYRLGSHMNHQQTYKYKHWHGSILVPRTCKRVTLKI